METTTVFLTDHDFEAIKAACRNRLNWSDGGRWNGRGKAPDCSATRFQAQTSSLLIRWPDAASARRWNIDMARNHRIVGYGVGLLTALAAAYLPGMNALRGAPAHFRDLAVAVVTGEALVEKEPAQVQLGESVKITIEMEYYEPARPRARPSFTTSITTEWFDDKGEVKIGPFRSRQHYSASNFPMDFAWRLVNQPPAHIVQNY